jgi:hypothetical protein
MTIPKDRIEESVEDIMDAVLPMIRERAISAVGPFKLLVQNVIENLVTDIENAYFPDAPPVLGLAYSGTQHERRTVSSQDEVHSSLLGLLLASTVRPGP